MAKQEFCLKKCHCDKISNEITFVCNTVERIDETRRWPSCKYRLLSFRHGREIKAFSFMVKKCSNPKTSKLKF